MTDHRVALIGDVVRSRESPDRDAVHRQLTEALTAVSTIAAIENPAVTVGDEFQGLYPTTGAAIDAAFRIRLSLMPIADTRYGLGRGSSRVIDPSTGIKDGSAWWAARAAVEAAEEIATRTAHGGVRTAYVIADEDADPCATAASGAINAALRCRDHMVSSLSKRSLRILRALLDHESQRDIAQSERISPSAVSQRIRTDGLAVIVSSHALLREVP